MKSSKKSLSTFEPNLAGLPACAAEATIAALDNDPGPTDPTDFNGLLGRIRAANRSLPKLYRQAAAQPFFDKLQALGESGFQQILLQDANKEGTAGLMLDIAQAILQDGEHFDEVKRTPLRRSWLICMTASSARRTVPESKCQTAPFFLRW